MKNYIKKSLKASNGITLIALVVTIIILLILAGISISMLSGDNGILQRATQSKEKTERAEIIENAQMDILAKISEKKGENLTASELEEILKSTDYKTQGNLSSEENILERTLTSKDGKYEIPVSEIYNGNLTAESTANTITFRLDMYLENDNPIFEAKEGMTWRQWITAYSPEYFSEYEWGTYVQYQPEGYRRLLLTAPDKNYPSVNMDDEIIKDAVYGLHNVDD